LQIHAGIFAADSVGLFKSVVPLGCIFETIFSPPQVVDTRTLERTQKQAGFSAAQEVLLKGRSNSVQVKRWQVALL
jgi:hypothetical protein